MEGLPVHVIKGTSIVAIPLIVVGMVVGGAVAPSMLVGVGHVAARLVVALGVGIGAVLVVVGPRAAPEAVLQRWALEVLVVRVDLLALVAVDGVGEWAAVGSVRAVAGGRFVM